jgi:NADPH2:quinone reductase
MVIQTFGGPEVFEAKELDRDEPGAGEVMVRVVATSVNPVDAKLRADGSWAGLEPPLVLGYDVAGVVEEVGPGVHGLEAGDEVYYTPEIFGNPRGSYAEFNTVPAALVAKKPTGVTFEEAAAIPLAGGTAWEAIVRRLRVGPGETVLIQGAAGGVGSYAVQFAKACGAFVIATAGEQNLPTLRQLGADVPVDYRKQDVSHVVLSETGGSGVDAAFDIEGDHIVSRCLPALRPGGRIACILGPQGDLTPIFHKNITVHGVFLSRERARLDEMRPLFERRLARSLVDQVLPLEQVADAHRRMDTHHGRGKVVLQVTER